MDVLARLPLLFLALAKRSHLQEYPSQEPSPITATDGSVGEEPLPHKDLFTVIAVKWLIDNYIIISDMP